MKLNSARLFGILFILSFISYATGTSLMGIIQNSQLQPFQVIESKISLLIGAFLIVIIHTVCNLGLLFTMFNVLKSTNKNLASIYFVLGSFGTFFLALGAVFLLLPIPISETNQLNNFNSSSFTIILGLSSGGNFYSYQFGMILWGCGGVIFCHLLYKSKLVSVVFAIWGSAGYLIFIGGCILELFGIPYGLALSIPGGLFEILLSIWLIAKGFTKMEVVSKARD